MKRTYRIERWITAILLTIFVLPFIAEAENFYVNRMRSQAAPEMHDAAQLEQRTPLPEDAVENAIDADPALEPFDESCC